MATTKTDPVQDAIKVGVDLFTTFLTGGDSKPAGVWTTAFNEKGSVKVVAFRDEVEALRFAVDKKSSTPQFVPFGEPTAIT